jgi:hypothetical protein
MLTKALSDTGLRGWHLHAGSFGAISLCIALWIRAKTVDQEERGNAERRALFVGLWPPMLWLVGSELQLEERAAHSRHGRGWVRTSDLSRVRRALSR